MSGSRGTLPISRTMVPPRHSVGTLIFVCLGTCRTPCGVAKRRAFFTSAIRDRSIIKFTQCRRRKNDREELKAEGHGPREDGVPHHKVWSRPSGCTSDLVTWEKGECHARPGNYS